MDPTVPDEKLFQNDDPNYLEKLTGEDRVSMDLFLQEQTAYIESLSEREQLILRMYADEYAEIINAYLRLDLDKMYTALNRLDIKEDLFIVFDDEPLNFGHVSEEGRKSFIRSYLTWNRLPLDTILPTDMLFPLDDIFTGFDFHWMSQDYLFKVLNKMVETIDGLIAAAPALKNELIVYRGVTKFHEFETGRPVRFSGYSSFSLLYEVARNYALGNFFDKNNGIIFYALISTGAKALYLKPVAKWTDEEEVLLPRESTFSACKCEGRQYSLKGGMYGPEGKTVVYDMCRLEYNSSGNENNL